ncbi:MAG TPA: site-2 protease family protein [Methylomirabilota bacterium]|jgi:Zn-dependent protease/CBS domain-containing protein
MLTGWSWKLGRIAGIDVYMHGTFLILLTWVGVSHYLERHRWIDAAAGLVFIVALFVIVVLHELGHALTARRYGIRTRDITLLPIGGVARLERMPDDPRQELLVAFAGPAVNVGLAVLLFTLMPSAMTTPALASVPAFDSGFIGRLAWVNVALAVFNLLPAFPMDGGRVLRALLALRMDYVRATGIAAEVGRGLALMLGLVGLFANPFLIFIALFVWVGATSEAAMVQLESALASIPVSRVMITRFQTLSPDDTLQRAVDHVLEGFQQDFPVVEGGRLVGVLTRADLMRALGDRGRETPVRSATSARFETTTPSEMLERAFRRLQGSPCPSMPVVHDGSLVGLLTLDNIGEFVAIQSSLRAMAKPGRAVRDEMVVDAPR